MEIPIPGKTVFILRQGPGYMHILSKADMNSYHNWQIQFVHGGLYDIDLSSNSPIDIWIQNRVISEPADAMSR